MFKKIYIFPIRCNVAALFFPHRLLILPKSNISWKVEKVFSSNFALTFYEGGAATAMETATASQHSSWSICQAFPSVFTRASSRIFLRFHQWLFTGPSLRSPSGLRHRSLSRAAAPASFLRFIFPQSALKNIVAAWSDTNSAYHFW